MYEPTATHCIDCGKPQNREDDSTTLNYYNRCRVCQRIKAVPRPWKKYVDGKLVYGCYFPSTDLNTGEMGGRGTGEPKDVEWL
jgi:hypothetical protein